MLVGRGVKALRGDTIIEVSFAIVIFAMVALISITLMNTGVTLAEGSLEDTMARNEMDAQAEALRFIQSSYLSEKELIPAQQVYKGLWDGLVAQAISGTQIDNMPANLTECTTAYNQAQAESLFNHKAFIMNTRNVNPYDVKGTIVDAKINSAMFAEAELYPRVIFRNNSGDNNDDNLAEMNSTGNYYNKVSRAEGIWIMAVKATDYNPEFYDFHIRTCWYAPGNENPTTMATIVRLYNPDFEAY